jgi:hypothetical protein
LHFHIGEKEKGMMLAKEALAIFEAIGAPISAVNAIHDMLKQWGVEE